MLSVFLLNLALQAPGQSHLKVEAYKGFTKMATDKYLGDPRKTSDFADYLPMNLTTLELASGKPFILIQI